MSKELDTPAAALPALGYDPTTQTITAADIPTPRLKAAQKSSKVTENGQVIFGQLFTQEGPDDPDPRVLEEPVVFYIIDYKNGRQYKDTDNEIQNLRPGEEDPDLSLVKDGAPWNIYDTTDFTVVLPEVDQLFPYKLFLSMRKSGRQGRKALLQHILKANIREEDFRLTAFELSTVKDSHGNNTWANYVVRRADVRAVDQEKHLETVAKIANAVATSPKPSNAPQIDAPALD